MMPEAERDDGDDEFYSWDFDNQTYGESDVADLISEETDE